MPDEYLNRWLAKGREDLLAARHLRQIEDCESVGDAICFHCQQAAEKYLKAYLVKNNVNFKKIHNLEYLVRMCSQIDKEFESLQTGTLSEYAVERRYPDSFYTPRADEIDLCIALCEKIRDFVHSRIGMSDYES